jgi:mono/diheme cytochrome c family protein
MLVFWLACAVCHGPRGMAHESEECLAEGSVWKSERLQRRAQVPFLGNTGWLDESQRAGRTSTECGANDGEPRCRAGEGEGRYRIVRPMESKIC